MAHLLLDLQEGALIGTSIAISKDGSSLSPSNKSKAPTHFCQNKTTLDDMVPSRTTSPSLRGYEVAPTNLFLASRRSSKLYLQKFEQPLVITLLKNSQGVVNCDSFPRLQFAGEHGGHLDCHWSPGFQWVGLPRHRIDFPALLLK